jgi:long-subunit fatty acid transport protein
MKLFNTKSKMIKRLLVAISLFLSFVSFAQENTASPYSFYGMGEQKFKGTVENRSMGGLSVIADSIHINLQNPAFYPYLKLTTLTTGASYATTKLKTNNDEEKARRTTLDYLAVGIPMGKLGAGFGLMPYTAVGYKIQTLLDDGVNPLQLRQYRGSGGLNKAFLGAGYQITKGLSFGAEFGYYFGDIKTTSIASISGVQYGTQEFNDSKANGPGFNAGLAYTSKVTKKLTFSASAIFSPETNLSLTNERQISTIRYLSNGQSIIIDQQDINVADSKVKMPSKFSFGSSIGESKKWMVGAEVTLIQSNDSGNRFDDINNAEYKNGMRYSIGGYFIPKYSSFSDYWKKINYRAGLKYEDTGLMINNKSIKDTGMTLGLGLPLSGTFSNLNFGFEYGKRGTRDASLVEENYVNFTLGLSFNDRWFVKRKYD